MRQNAWKCTKILKFSWGGHELGHFGPVKMSLVHWKFSTALKLLSVQHWDLNSYLAHDCWNYLAAPANPISNS